MSGPHWRVFIVELREMTMTAARLLRRPAALIVFVTVWILVGSINAKAQQSNDLNILNKQVVQLYHTGKYAEATDIAKRALALAERQFGANGAEVGNALSNLAELYRAQGRYVEAEPLYKRSLAIDEKTLALDHPTLGTHLSNLALLYRAQGRYAEAEPLYKRALAIAEKALGPNHPDVGRDLYNLSELYDNEGRYTEAEPLLERALAIDEKALGPDHPDVGSDLNGLAALYQDRGRYAEAEPLYKRALAIAEKALGPDHPDVGTDLNNFAELYRVQGRYAEAEPLYKRALAIDEKALGPEHPDFGRDLNNLAELYRVQGRYAEAEPLYNRGLAIDEKALGPDHPDVGRDLNKLAGLYRVQGRYAEAESLYKRALAIAEKALGPDHRNVGAELSNLAGLYHDQARYAEAEPLYKRALAIAEKSLGPDHPDVGIYLNNLARLYEDQGKQKEAEPLYQRAIAIGEKALGPDHPNLALTRSNLGGFYKSLGRYGEAEPLLKSALDINEKIFGPAHPKVAYGLSQLGDLYRLEGKCGQSDALFVRAQSIGGEAVREVPVLFGTDRKRDTTQPSVTFGGEREEKLSFGLVIVTVPEPQTNAPTQRVRSDTKTTGGQITEARRIAMHCIEVVGDRQIVEAAVHQVDGARIYPSQALIFVHGYNVSFENAARRTAQIAYDIKFDGATFLFSWPSRERLLGYLSDSDTVQIAADHLRDFLQKVIAETKVTKIHFVAHSMGNMVLLRALERIVRENASLRGLIGEIIEAAPDVDEGVYRHMLETINPDADHKFTLYASRGDWALWASGLLRGLARAGYISKDKPLIVPGVDTIDITSAGTSLFDLNHDLYSSNPTLVADMRRIIEKGEWPPDKRTKEFEPVTSKDGTYWRLLPPQVQTANH
jgi:esterase/lipase superfamily enzyme/Tfp pilus assembly protein PilF